MPALLTSIAMENWTCLSHATSTGILAKINAAVDRERRQWETKQDAETVPRWQVDALVQAEREACAVVAQDAGANTDVAAAIRARGAR